MSWENRQRVDSSVPSQPHRPPLVLLVSLLLWVFPTAAIAQQRPLITEDPRPIAEGALVAEVGFAYFNRARFPLSGLGGNELAAFDTGLNFGLGPRAEFQMNWVGQNFLWVHENGAG